MGYHFGYVVCPESCREHIGRRGLDFDDIRDAVQWPSQTISVVWVDVPDDPRRPRVIVRGTTSTGRVIDVVLYPMNPDDPEEGTWRLGMAFDA